MTTFTTPLRSVTTSGALVWSDTQGYALAGLTYVTALADLPEAVGGVITLADDTGYFFTQAVDLGGARLVAGQNTAILGVSSESSVISSTGLSVGQPLLSSAWSLPVRNVAFTRADAGPVLALAGDGVTTALDWFGVNFVDVENVGTIEDYSNVIWDTCGLLDSAGLVFDGTIGTIGLEQCILSGRAGATTVTLPATATITRRFRIVYSAVPTPATGTGINVSASATIPVEGYILDTVNFSGSGTATAGVAYDDNKALWVENKGVINSAALGYMTMNGNAVATDIVSQGVAVKVAGTTVVQTPTQKFSHSNNRLTYVGAVRRTFKVSTVLSFTSGNGNLIGVYVAKNGTLVASSETYSTANASGRAENTVSQAIVELAQNDFVEIWVENDAATTDITVSEMSVIVEALN